MRFEPGNSAFLLVNNKMASLRGKMKSCFRFANRRFHDTPMAPLSAAAVAFMNTEEEKAVGKWSCETRGLTDTSKCCLNS